MKRQNRKNSSRFAASFAVLAVLATALPIAVVTDADAQQQQRVRRGWSLFDVFAPRREKIYSYKEAPGYNEFPPPPRAPKASKPRKPKSRVVAASTPDDLAPGMATELPSVEKLPDARTVLVIGDFLGAGLAEGLTDAFARQARVRVLDRTQGSSGFVREDVYNWPAEIAALIDKEKPAAIVVMMGSNDRQQMRVGDKREAAGSDGWVDAYEGRTSALAEAVEAKKVPLLWVSMPPFKSAKMTSDMVAFNDIYKTAAEAGGGEYIDIWDGFSDESGAFVSTGPDINGQPVRLRGNDGINITKAGKAKAAYYVDKPLRKLLGLPAQDGGAQPAITISPDGPKLPRAVDRTEPMALNDPGMDGATELLGASVNAGGNAEAASVASGAPPTGRADDFMASVPAAATPDDPAPTASR